MTHQFIGDDLCTSHHLFARRLIHFLAGFVKDLVEHVLHPRHPKLNALNLLHLPGLKRRDLRAMQHRDHNLNHQSSITIGITCQMRGTRGTSLQSQVDPKRVIV